MTAIKRARRAIERSPCGRYWFDRAAADAAVDFFPRYLRFTEGEWAGRPFVLEEWQARDIIRPLFGWKRADGTRRYRRCIVWIPRKNGKALALNTPIPTPAGWTTMGAIQPGDVVFDDVGRPCCVTFATPVQYDRVCYRVTFSDGTSVVADAAHQWFASPKDGAARVVTTEQMRARLTVGSRSTHRERNWTVALGGALVLPDADLPIDPYTFGAWIGDGHQGDARISLGPDKAHVLARISRTMDARLVPSSSDDSAPSYWLCESGAPRGDQIVCRLRALGVLGDKHIPSLYLRASIVQRRAVLEGIIDTDGHVEHHGQIEIVTISPRLRDDLLDLIRGLGFKVTVGADRARIGMRDCGPRWRVRFFLAPDDGLTLRSRHAEKLRSRPDGKARRDTLKIIAIDPVESVPVRCIQVDSPTRLYRAGMGMTVTHNTELAAGVALLALMGDGEAGGQVFSIAKDRDQARIVFNKAVTMIGWSPELSTHLTCFTTAIYCPALVASFKPLSGTSAGKHGLSMSGLVGDEIHEWSDGRLYTFVHQSSAARRQPLEFLISTAGERAGYGWDVWGDCQKILSGDIDDPETLVVIYAADPDDDWTLPETWAKANPNLGVSVKLEYLTSECQKARELPRLENDFKRYHLNIWTEQAVRWLPIAKWDACEEANKDVFPVGGWREMAARLQGRLCFAGIDLSSTTDLTAYVLVFPPEQEGGAWHVLPRFFLPAARIAERVRRDRVRYDEWARAGALIVTPGNVVDYGYLKHELFADAERYRLRKVALDPWNATQLAVEINAEGLEAVLFRQGYLSMSGPSKELERLVLSGKIIHGGHPVLRWNVGNVAVDSDAAGNIKPAKDKSTERIDGVVGLIEGLGVALAEPPAPRTYIQDNEMVVL